MRYVSRYLFIGLFSTLYNIFAHFFYDAWQCNIIGTLVGSGGNTGLCDASSAVA